MKATLRWLGVVLLAATTASFAQAGFLCKLGYGPCACNPCRPRPANAFSTAYCPAYNSFSKPCCPPCCYPGGGGPLVLPPQPYSGIQAPGNMPTGFSVHPFVRGPRDFFMMD
jgi:hypothetical protein